MKMRQRKGLGIGMGMGYKNLVPLDPYIHSLSAKGVRTYAVTGTGFAFQHEVKARDKKEAIKKVDKVLDGELTRLEQAGGEVEVWRVKAKGKKKQLIADTIKNPPARKFLARDTKGKYGYATINMADLMFRKEGEFYVLPNKEMVNWRNFDAVDKAIKQYITDKHYEKYAEEELQGLKSGYEGDELFQVKKYVRIGTKIYEHYSPEQAKYNDIKKGKHKINSLKLSENQAYGEKPKYESYYEKDVRSFDKKEIYRKGIKDPLAKTYHRGLIVKVSGDYDSALSDEHNTWAIIDEVIDPYHFKVIQEGSNKRLTIRDTDVK